MGGVHSIGFFGKPWTKLPEREYVADLDWYGTGHPRKIFWYRDWDLYKGIYWGKTGDITGNTTKTEIPSRHDSRLDKNYKGMYAKNCERLCIEQCLWYNW